MSWIKYELEIKYLCGNNIRNRIISFKSQEDRDKEYDRIFPIWKTFVDKGKDSLISIAKQFQIPLSDIQNISTKDSKYYSNTEENKIF